MKAILAPSMMCCNFVNLKAQLDIFEEKKIEYLHIDIMDGSFVPNMALGTDFVSALKKATKIPLDLHFMTELPERTTEYFEISEDDFVSVHAETTRHLQRVLTALRRRGAKTMVALNPATPICMIEDVLDDIDGVLIMSVNPGFAGQKMVEHSLKKIAHLRKLLDNNGKQDVIIEVDGNVSPENAVLMKNAGADMFVLGSSGIFKGDLSKNIDSIRQKLD